MKKIFVTVAEFLENNNEDDVLINRRVFKRNGYTNEIEEDGKIERYSEGSYYYDDNMHSEYLEVDIDEMFVQIDCTPHYK